MQATVPSRAAGGVTARRTMALVTAASGGVKVRESGRQGEMFFFFV
jgi:hypothetical protein